MEVKIISTGFNVSGVGTEGVEPVYASVDDAGDKSWGVTRFWRDVEV